MSKHAVDSLVILACAREPFPSAQRLGALGTSIVEKGRFVMSKGLTTTVATALAPLAMLVAAKAQLPCPGVPFFSPQSEGPLQNEKLGYVAIGGSVMVAGARQHSTATGVSAAGAAFVYEFIYEWNFVQTLVSDLPSENGGFGNTVATDGALIVIGEPRTTVNGIDEAGAIHVFARAQDQWTHTARLEASNPQSETLFGGGDSQSVHQHVAVDGRVIVAGAPNWSPDSELRKGRVHVFMWSPTLGWSETHVLTADDVPGLEPAEFASFGMSVDVSDGRIVIGEPGRDGTGAAYVFSYNQVTDEWDFVTELTPAAGKSEGDGYGVAVAIDRFAVVGAVGGNYATVFRAPSWVDDGEVTASETVLFGTSVATNGNLVLVGDPYFVAKANYPWGGAFLYERQSPGNWSHLKTFVPPSNFNTSFFADDLDISGVNAVIGAWDAAVLNQSSAKDGAAFLFTSLPECNSTLPSE